MNKKSLLLLVLIVDLVILTIKSSPVLACDGGLEWSCVESVLGTSEDWVQTTIIDVLTPNCVLFLSALAGVTAVKIMIYR